MKHYNDSSYAYSRISGTICLWKDKPVYIAGFDPDNDRRSSKVTVHCPIGEWRKVVDIKEINLNPPKLGYYNPKGADRNAFFVCRTPKRSEWRQGIRSSALVNGKNLQSLMLNNYQIAKIIRGNYPSFSDAMSSSREFGAKRAFHRDFAVVHSKGNTFSVEYKGVEIVAKVVEGTVSMIEGKQWAFEALQEATGKNERFENEENSPAIAAF